MFDDTYDRDKSEWAKKVRGIDFVEARAVFSERPPREDEKEQYEVAK